MTPDGARVACGGLVRVGLDAGEASGALERKRRIRELEGLEPDLAAIFEHASDQVVEANAAVEEARAAEGDAAGEIARLEGERRSLLSEIGRLEQSANNAEVERVRISKRREQAPRPFALRARALTNSPVRATRPARRQATWVSRLPKPTTSSIACVVTIPRQPASSPMPRSAWLRRASVCVR